MMSSLSIKFDNDTSECVTGFDFLYDDGSIASMGYQGTSIITIPTLYTKPFYSISSTCDSTCTIIQICLNDTTQYPSQIICFKAGNTEIPLETVLYTQGFQILEIEANFGSINCLENLGIRYILNQCDRNSCRENDTNCDGCTCLNSNLENQCTSAIAINETLSSNLLKLKVIFNTRMEFHGLFSDLVE
jgi:hypothetical protein